MILEVTKPGLPFSSRKFMRLGFACPPIASQRHRKIKVLDDHNLIMISWAKAHGGKPSKFGLQEWQTKYNKAMARQLRIKFEDVF
jgi:hypothetical protein